MTRRVALPLIQAADEIDQAISRALQRVVGRCRVGDRDHQGLIWLVSTVCRHTIERCLPPGVRPTYSTALDEVQQWCQSPFALKVKALRSQALEAAHSAEAATRDAVVQIRTLSAPARDAQEGVPPLQSHTEHVIARHAMLATYYATSTVVLTLDAMEEPKRALNVPLQVAGALAHHATWLICARNNRLQQEAAEQAAWWHERHAQGHSSHELALHLFHEFLGTTWKAHRDAEYARVSAFVDWALPQ